MKVRKTTVLAGMLMGVAAIGLMSGIAKAGTAVDTVSLTVTPPTEVVTIVNGLNFGDAYVAINHATASANAVITAAGTLTNTTGTPGSARLIPIDTTNKSPLEVNLAGGVASTAMALSIVDDNTPANVAVAVTDGGSDATFKIDTWTADTTGTGTLTGFTGTTGKGTVTTDATGAFDWKFGAKLSTVPGALAYPTSSTLYTGKIRVTISY